MSNSETSAFGSMSNSQAAMAMAAMSSTLVARDKFANPMKEQFGGDRDLFDTLGYEDTLSYADYESWYERGDIAKVIIDKPAETTWRERPKIIDDAEVGEDESTEFEDDVEALFDAGDETNLNRGLRHYFERADKLARLGEYGVIFMGFSDVESEKELRLPVDPSGIDNLNDLLFLTPLGEGDAGINSWETDITNPRLGRPKTYDLTLSMGGTTKSLVVHHSRVIHIAEGVLDNETSGEPALRAVINRLFDLQKVIGSGAEAYWLLSNPGLAVSVDPEYADIPTDKMDDQIEEYEHGIRRVMKLFGANIERLDGDDVDPSGIMDAIIKLISGTVEIPTRKLIGSERGELASSQDEASYLEMISARQTSYSEPVMLREIIDRLLEFGVIRPPREGSYSVEWPNLFQLTELEEADLGLKLAKMVRQLAPMKEPDMLHSLEALQEFSPIEEPDGAEPPEPVDEPPEDDPGEDEPPEEEDDDDDAVDDPADEIDEDDEEVQKQFQQMKQRPLVADGGTEEESNR